MVIDRLRPLLGSLLIVSLGLLPPSVGAEEAPAPRQGGVLELSLPELVQVRVTSVTKKEQELSHAPAAIFVLTGEDIRRSGVSSIPEALQMVPGISVAKMDNNTWTIASRGFKGRQKYANKLLVLMDGRTVYTSLFSGVNWESQDTALYDIERIEVIRGPGASVWGANAVNGVINIITKSAAKTQGLKASVTTGTEDKALVSLRYGGEINEDTPYRIYAKYRNRDSSYVSASQDGHDEYESGQMGFRIDSTINSRAKLTVQGDFYDSDVERSITTFESMTAPGPTVDLDTADNSGG
ncbi:MAG: TonB-dependent receptor plug domain-containing protein, partial [Deltaproteobacteria bacterium]|nr:TonB-dependent receptor plug domain-containing protein [Deltaproteobacteria bacterium]